MKPFLIDERHKKIIQIDFQFGNQITKNIKFKNDYLNINSINLDLTENVYRIFNWDYFIKDLHNKKLTLVRPHKWDDPFENFLLNAQGKLNDGRIVDLQIVRNSFYALCWTLKQDCDGIWRNYKGNNKCVIKAKSNAKKLFESYYNFKNGNHYLSFFIGKVDYVSDDKIEEYFKNELDFSNYQNVIEFVLTLLMKRQAFAYEKEVRIIIYNKNNPKSNFIQIPIDPNVLYDELTLDPWINPLEFNKKVKELRNAGFNGNINRSSLYDKPFFIVKIKN